MPTWSSSILHTCTPSHMHQYWGTVELPKPTPEVQRAAVQLGQSQDMGALAFWIPGLKKQKSESLIPCKVRLQASEKQRARPVPCREARQCLHGDSQHSGLLLAGLGEGHEVTARPGSPGQLCLLRFTLSTPPLPLQEPEAQSSPWGPLSLVLT